MCNLSQGIEDRGIQKGIEKGMEKGLLKAAKNLMKLYNWSKEQALRSVGVPEQELYKYLAMF